jgi:hypothetical protein
MKPRNGIEQALDWWETLTREDKSRWLQCAATPEEIDADLSSPDPNIRAAAGIASVGDAWAAFRASSNIRRRLPIRAACLAR